MADSIEHLDLEARARVAQMACELSRYGLGISSPHMHNHHGTRTELPPHMASLERFGKVSFLEAGEIGDAEAVGWRWLDGELVAFAFCCAPAGPPD